MKVIGIDPGTKVTGFGIIELKDNKYEIVDYGTIKPRANLSLAEKLKEIKQDLEEIVSKYNPEAAALENLFYAQNVKTALVLGGVRGVILSVLAAHECPIFEYSPLEVKKAVTGYGRAEKSQVMEMILHLTGIQDKKIEKDVTDALAIALCHLNSVNFLKKIQEK
jgi:crossover junction endodeoxyribonuclease RuvC